MTEYFDDYEDDFFDEGEFMDDDFEDTYGEHLDEFDLEEPFEDELESEFDEEPPVEDEHDPDIEECDGFTGKEAYLYGTAAAIGYNLGLEEGERRRLDKELGSKRRRRNRKNKDL